MSNQYNGLLVSKMSQSLDAGQNAALYARVAAGDAAAREEMIVGNMPMATASVERLLHYLPQAGRLRDDLTGAAFLGLTKAVNHMANGVEIRVPEAWTVAGCIGAWIDRELSNLIDNSPLIHPSARSRYRARARGRELRPPDVHHAVPGDLGGPSYDGALEARDALVARCACDEQRAFVALRVAGRTRTEIAAVLGKSLMAVCRMESRLEARLRHELGLSPAKKCLRARPKSAAPCHL